MTQGRPGCMFPHHWEGPHPTFTPAHLPDPAEDLPLWVSLERGVLVAHEAECDAVLGVLAEAQWEPTLKRPERVGPDPRPPRVYASAMSQAQAWAWAKHAEICKELGL
jgi:hypothetical protein